MRVNLSVLEEVRHELETSQDITARPVITAVRSLSHDYLDMLGALCVCDGQATFEQIWAIHRVFDGAPQHEKEELQTALDHFIRSGILTMDAVGRVKFIGDDFDRIYTKYFAGEQEILISFYGYPPEFLWHQRIQNLVMTRSGSRDDGALYKSDLVSIALDGVRDTDISVAAEKMGTNEDVFSESPSVARALYMLMLCHRATSSLPVLSLSLECAGTSLREVYSTYDIHGTAKLESVLSKLAIIRERILEMQGRIDAKIMQVPICPFERLADQVHKSANERVRYSLALYHADEMIDSYLTNPETAEAKFHADAAYRYNPTPEPPNSNNLGYLYLSISNYDRARSLLQNAIMQLQEGMPKQEPEYGFPPETEGADTLALATYNLAILEAMIGNPQMGLTRARAAIDRLIAIRSRTSECACLWVPGFAGGELTFREVREVELLQIAEEAVSQLEAYERERNQWNT